MAGVTHPSAYLSPEDQWDAVPLNAKWKIITVIGTLEIWDECGGGVLPHYMKGRKPGQYPSFQLFRDNVNFVLDLYDPFGLSNKKSEEQKERGRIVKLKNGRLAQIGIFGFLAADEVEGSVSLLNSIAIPYEGNPMIPLEGKFSLFN